MMSEHLSIPDHIHRHINKIAKKFDINITMEPIVDTNWIQGGWDDAVPIKKVKGILLNIKINE